MRYIVGIIGAVAGGLIVLKAEAIYRNFGPVGWAEQHLGTEGGSRLFYKLVGLAIALFSLLYMSGLLESIVLSIFGPLFGIRN